jgi:hypothetical protein
MPYLLSPTLGTLLLFWLLCALLTFLIHAGASLAIDRRLSFGLWEQLALMLFMTLGPAGVCLEVRLVWLVLQDIRPQLKS